MNPRIPEKIIDFHVHLFPDKLFEAIWRQFEHDYDWKVIHQLYYRECIDYLRERNVEKIVYCNYAHKPGVAKSLNEWNAKVLDEYDDLYCLAAFHPGDEGCIALARDILTHPKVLGIKLQFLVTDFFPHDPRLFDLYELIMEKGKRLLMHIGTGPVANDCVGLEYFLNVLERYPDLPVTVPHMGGLEFKGFMDLLDKHENLMLDTAFSFLPWDNVRYDQGPEKLEKYKNRILYGSDFPNLILPREGEIDAMLEMKLSQEFYDKVFWENGVGLLPQ
ncbi:amidohydrolase 2 [Desulfatibacillum aliphaticivorans]|uniref:Amidohydrolase 2 n=1 Tax=Desulfatibacillum aliphaticivorans TaxID=218208 RepID=B8FJP6_DESAL|nr:amidohydrolase family protein [Desulfatibacillum aliphaticivorans]ACL02324.1 amidohydrolase 2 [Desulfatibacillum aliphaticivorans]